MRGARASAGKEEDAALPRAVAREIARKGGVVARVYGDSMEPVILDFDRVVVVRRAPRDGDVVCVRMTHMLPPYGTFARGIWRFREGDLLTRGAAGEPVRLRPCVR